MPTYDFKCSKCDKVFERFLPVNFTYKPKCEYCGNNYTEQLITGGTGFILNGSGFYVNDYKKKGK